jgi:hypothetical protein
LGISSVFESKPQIFDDLKDKSRKEISIIIGALLHHIHSNVFD